MNRRMFLGTVAALGGLSAPATVTDEADDDLDSEPDSDPYEDTHRLDVLQTSGGYEAFDGHARKTKVQLMSHSETATLQLQNEFITLDAMLLPEDIDKLCEKLQAAKARMDAEDVAHAREWVTEGYKEQE